MEKFVNHRLLIGAVAIMLAVAVLAIERPDLWRGWFVPSEKQTSLTVSGNIEAHESVLGFKTIQSRIVELPFEEGQWVKAGTLVARADDMDYRQQLKLAAAALTVQQRSLASVEQTLIAAQKTVMSDQADVVLKTTQAERAQLLWGKGAVSTDARDTAIAANTQAQAQFERDQALVGAAQRNIELAKANVHNAEENLALAKIVLDYTRLVAPFDGVVVVREAELGEIVAPATPVITLADLDHVWLRAYINETDIGKVRLGIPVTISTDTYPGKAYEGRVSFIASDAEFTPKTVQTQAQRVTLVYRIKIDVANPTHELLPGMPADAVIQVAP
jgi:HlyD family secretion protein